MAQKTALVVDDSLTARRILGRMLERHSLAVETAKSAEEALEYLGRHRPDVVFMDHMMPGMDGMEALKAIKGDPNTAMVPVVMYTAKEGQLHVGQARALGAIGILSKQLRSGELFEVLRSLGLAAEKRSEGDDADKPVPDERRSPSADDDPGTVAEITLGNESIEQIARAAAAYVTNSVGQVQERRLAEERITQLRHSVSQLRQEVSELTRQQSDGRSELPQAVANEVQIRLLAVQEDAAGTGILQRFRLPLVLAIAMLLVIPVAIGFGMYLSDREGGTLSGDRTLWMMDTVAWALSDEGAFAFGEVVFDDRRLERLEGLVARLSWLDFDGVIRLESHLGRPCLIGSPADGYEMPPGDWPLDSCDYLGVSDDEARELGALRSDAFESFLAERESGSSGGIRIEIMSRGHEEQSYSYPEEEEGMTAEDWNRVATRNNRVTVSLIPD